MSEKTKDPATPEAVAPEPSPGFFSRLLRKLDGKMKQQAEAKAQGSGCCGTGKKDKCC